MGKNHDAHEQYLLACKEELEITLAGVNLLLDKKKKAKDLAAEMGISHLRLGVEIRNRFLARINQLVDKDLSEKVIAAIDSPAYQFMKAMFKMESTLRLPEVDEVQFWAVVRDVLPDREWYVITQRYGDPTEYFLKGEVNLHTLEEISVGFGITRERVRQIEVKGLRRLRNPAVLRKLIPAYDWCELEAVMEKDKRDEYDLDARIQAQADGTKKLMETYRKAKYSFDRMDNTPQEYQARVDALLAEMEDAIVSRGGQVPGKELLDKSYAQLSDENTSIEELCLSVRPYNCLRKQGVQTIAQLREQYPDFHSLIEIRGMGTQSAQEILDSLQRLAG